ncbi:hypothetical protein KCV87_29195 [Actinosynnema pretiosum subsp. pretiosum]|uniref:Uncharacterized protein n=1 Tax=Actinosynnema pretiosum subsp. pretiosum TaxID=103721 RepID=A0AA45L4L8_9PSEU|nr:hypothetical protein APASM_5305 [Actinosynnema pretiosum subsp. pretiosum]QUF03444.1 hypothetical protein KCV87_29195 [Actinosynnema pretiosum subsp. pretiosum]
MRDPVAGGRGRWRWLSGWRERHWLTAPSARSGAVSGEHGAVGGEHGAVSGEHGAVSGEHGAVSGEHGAVGQIRRGRRNTARRNTAKCGAVQHKPAWCGVNQPGAF